MRVAGPLLLLLAALLAGAVEGEAAAAWSAPERLGHPSRAPELLFSRTGHGLVAASPTSGATTRLVTIAPGGGRPPVARTVRERVRPIVTFGRDRVVALRRRVLRRPRGPGRVRLGVSFGTSAAPLGAFRPLDTDRDVVAPRLSSNARGDAVAMWNVFRRSADPDEPAIVTRVAVRRAGGAFGRPRTIAVYDPSRPGGAFGEEVAVTPDGEILVVLVSGLWPAPERERKVRIAVLGRDGRVARTEVAGRHLGSVQVGLGVSAGGRVVVAWGTSDGGEQVDLPLEVWATARSPRGRRFAAARVVGRGGRAALVSPGGVAVAVGADGSAVVAWATTERGSAAYPVRVASATPTGRFGAPQTVAADGIMGDVAVGPGGRAAVVWMSSDGEDHQNGVQVFAAVRPARGAPFGPGEPVSPPERAMDPAVAYDPGTGQPVIAWSGAPTARRVLSLSRYVP